MILSWNIHQLLSFSCVVELLDRGGLSRERLHGFREMLDVMFFSPCILMCLAAITKHHKLSGFSNRNVFFLVLDWKSELKMPAGWVLLWPLSLALHMAPSCCDLTWLSPVGIYIFLNQDTNDTELCPIHIILFNLNYLVKGPLIKHSHILRY